MTNDTLKKLEAARAKVAALEANIAAQRSKELATLPGRYGFDSTDEFIKALRAAGNGGGSTSGGSASSGSSAPSRREQSGGGGGRRRRAVITDETKDQVKALVEEGRTGAEIAKSLHISLPSVQNIKKQLGLVKARGGKRK